MNESPRSAYVLKKASRGIPVKIIAVYHNDPSTNGRLKDVEIAMEKNRNIVVYLGLKMKYWLYRQITAAIIFTGIPLEAFFKT